jgi:drug/metabolite transporter (DMT)-like permease
VAWAEQYVPSGVTALIIGIQPVFMVTTEWAWPGGHRPARGVLVGMALGFVGVALLAAPWERSAHGAVSTPGVVAILLACVSWAFGSIYGRHAKPAAPPFVAAAAQMLCGSAALALVGGLRGEFGTIELEAITARSWTAFIYLVFFGSLVGFSTFVWLMKHSTPARVSTYAYVNPVVAVFLGWLILDEPVSPRTLLSAAIIVAAVVIVTTQKNRRVAPPATIPGPARFSTTDEHG